MKHRIIAAAVLAGLVAALAGAAAPAAVAQSRLDRLIDRCRGYSDTAVRQSQVNQRRNCGYQGPRWSFDRIGHFRWCVNAAPGERRRETEVRSAALERCRRPGACTREYRPVCGFIGGDRRTFANACVARRAGARAIRPGPCRDPGPGPGPGPGPAGACRLDAARLTVSSPGCSPRTMQLRFARRFLRNGASVLGELNSGTIGQGFPPWGVCNFHTRIRYVCRNGRLRIGQVHQCRQARTGPTAADCSVSN